LAAERAPFLLLSEIPAALAVVVAGGIFLVARALRAKVMLVEPAAIMSLQTTPLGVVAVQVKWAAMLLAQLLLATGAMGLNP
jgi:hypothetical protein